MNTTERDAPLIENSESWMFPLARKHHFIFLNKNVGWFCPRSEPSYISLNLSTSFGIEFIYILLISTELF